MKNCNIKIIENIFRRWTISVKQLSTLLVLNNNWISKTRQKLCIFPYLISGFSLALPQSASNCSLWLYYFSIASRSVAPRNETSEQSSQTTPWSIDGAIVMHCRLLVCPFTCEEIVHSYLFWPRKLTKTHHRTCYAIDCFALKQLIILTLWCTDQQKYSWEA